MVAQRRAMQVAVVPAAAFELWNDQIDKILQAFRNDREAEDETIGSTLVDPLDELVGDLNARTHELVAWRRHVEGDFAQRQVLFLRRGLDAVGSRAEGILADLAEFGERRIRIVLREVVMIEETAQIGECIVERDQVANAAILLLRLSTGAPDNRANAGEDLDVVARAAMGDGARLDLIEEGAGLFKTRRMGEDRIGIFAGELDARIRRTCLEDDRLALRRAADIQWARHLEEATFVVQRMQFLLVEKLSRLPVADDGVVIPAIPEALRDLQIFVRNLVAQRMFGMRPAVIGGSPFQRRGDDIPARPALGDQVERTKLSGNGERIGIGGRDRTGEPDFAGAGGQRRENRERLEPVEEMRDRLLVDVETIGDKGEGNARCLGLERRVDIEIQIDARIGGAARMPPGIHVAACAMQHDAEFQLFLAHGSLPS